MILKESMNNRIIKTEEEYNKACARIFEIIQMNDAPVLADSAEGEELDFLSILVEKYERENYPIPAPSPIEAIKFRMEQLDLKQADIAPLFGGKTRVSEVLNKKRPLTLKMISLLHEYLEIPLESLISGENQYSLDSKAKEQILKNPAFRNLQIRRKRVIV